MPTETEIIESDNGKHDGLSRCGCPSWRCAAGWQQIVFNLGLAPVLIAQCQICGATWEWGEVCAQEAGSKGGRGVTIQERAQVALEGAKARTDVEDFAAHILRITSPEMRERIADAVRAADIGQRLWGADVQDLTAAIMGLLTEEPCDST